MRVLPLCAATLQSNNISCNKKVLIPSIFAPLFKPSFGMESMLRHNPQKGEECKYRIFLRYLKCFLLTSNPPTNTAKSRLSWNRWKKNGNAKDENLSLLARTTCLLQPSPAHEIWCWFREILTLTVSPNFSVRIGKMNSKTVGHKI